MPWQEIEASLAHLLETARSKVVEAAKAEGIEQSAILMQCLGVKPEVVYADLGYWGVDKDNPDIQIKHRGDD